MHKFSAPRMIAFGRFELDTRREVLLVDGKPVELQTRAVELLAFLIERRDDVVSRDEILAHVWHGRAVSDNNLPVQMCALRRVLAAYGGAELIATFTGRGYRFVGDIEETDIFANPILHYSMPMAYAASQVTMGAIC